MQDEIKKIFPLQSLIFKKPWVGNRSSLPDSMAVIGETNQHKGLWLAFEHGHLELTQGPKIGQIIAHRLANQKVTANQLELEYRFSPNRFN